jgi:beta-N-acetylhexosaminidase
MDRVVASILTVVLATIGVPPSVAAQLSLRQQAGQRVVYSYPGLTPPPELLQDIRNGEVAGVIFFKDNISGTSQIRGVADQLTAANEQSPVKAPLLLMTDQEGGLVRRLPGAPVLSAKQVGQASNPIAAAEESGTTAGENLRSAGMNVNLAPVLDVYRQPGDFLDQAQRSYSQDPLSVQSLGRGFVTAQQRVTGVAATGKHFPGLGSAAAQQNTDVGPVTLNVPLATLRSVDEQPYTAGAKLIMLSWAVYPALDPSLPAGLSPTVVQTELRDRVGFTGVTISDAIEAGALQAYGTTGQRVVLAAKGGIDLVLCSVRNVQQGQDAVTALADGLGSGQLDQATFTSAAQRVTALRVSVG